MRASLPACFARAAWLSEAAGRDVKLVFIRSLLSYYTFSFKITWQLYTALALAKITAPSQGILCYNTNQRMEKGRCRPTCIPHVTLFSGIKGPRLLSLDHSFKFKITGQPRKLAVRSKDIEV